LEDVARFLAESIRFAGMAGYNPFDAVDSGREMEAARALGFRGTYVNVTGFGLRLSDARLYPLWAKSAELCWPALVQVPLAEPDLARSLERIGSDFPELSLALAHPRPSAEMFAVGERFERLAYVMDSAALDWMWAHQRSLLDDANLVERCLWGSNGAPLAQTAAAAMALDLPLETLERIVRTNTLRFFAAEPPQRTPRSLPDEITSAER
jgi:predicted TIM-barrel fold metal-dependent hydrolase